MKTPKTIIGILFFIATFNIVVQSKAFEVVVKGEEQPILFFSGVTCTGDVWEDSVKELSKEYECHVFTFAGFGEVAPIEKPWLSKVKYAIIDYVEQQNLNKPIIIGHSLGGTLGLWLATDENSPYSKLIVVDALPSTGALMMPNLTVKYGL